MKKILILIAAALIFMIACDVLDHDAYKNEDLENFFSDFSTAFENIDEENVDAVMVYYDSTYSHNLTTKAEMEDFFLGLFELNPGTVRFHAELDSYNRFNTDLNWTLGITWEDVVNDTLTNVVTENIKFYETYVTDGTDYKFYGNQLDPPALDPTKPVVFAEYGTAESCGNCPAISKKLDLMKKKTYGGQFIYVAFCQNEPVDPYTEFFTYYGAYTQPYVVTQGTLHNEGGTDDNVALTDTHYEEVLVGEPEAFITDIIWSEETAGTIAGSVNLDIGSVPTTDLYLRVFILDEHPDLHYHVDGSPLHNVVFATYNIPVTGSGVVNYSLEYTQENYPTLPAKGNIVFALQTKPDDYDIATSKVYTAAEAKLYED